MTRFDIQPNSLYLFTTPATLMQEPHILRRRTTKLRAKRSFPRSLWFFRVSSQSPRLFSPVLRASQQTVQNVSTNRRRSQRSMLEKGNFTLKVTNDLATSCGLPYGTNIAHPTARPHARCKKQSGKRYWSHKITVLHTDICTAVPSLPNNSSASTIQLATLSKNSPANVKTKLHILLPRSEFLQLPAYLRYTASFFYED
jgi:hypothetical protein